jgi:hypothetical protein
VIETCAATLGSGRTVGVGTQTELLIRVGRQPALSVLLLLALAVYRFAPSRRLPKWRWISIGSIVATRCSTATDARPLLIAYSIDNDLAPCP